MDSMQIGLKRGTLSLTSPRSGY